MFGKTVGLDERHVIQDLVGFVKHLDDVRVDFAICAHTRGQVGQGRVGACKGCHLKTP